MKETTTGAGRVRMVDLQGQYEKIKEEVDSAIGEVLKSSAFINGPQVKSFEAHLATYLGVGHVIGCGNGTDALQIALMALGLKAGDEVIVPAFTYVATAEVIGLLGLTPVLVDVDYGTFNVGVEHIKKALSPRTRAIVPVHLFGQSCDMGPILDLAGEYGLWVVEDNAQAIGAEYRFGEDCYRYFPGQERRGEPVSGQEPGRRPIWEADQEHFNKHPDSRSKDRELLLRAEAWASAGRRGSGYAKRSAKEGEDELGQMPGETAESSGSLRDGAGESHPCHVGPGGETGGAKGEARGMLFRKGSVRKTGTMGHIGCTSFFPSKNLGCYGDGGALMTDDDELAEKIRMIANHGQREKYHHQVIGCNSRLDTLQAAVLDVKLKYLDGYNRARHEAARYYTQKLRELDPQGKYYITPEEAEYSTHVYHQYTLKIRSPRENEEKQLVCKDRNDINKGDKAGEANRMTSYEESQDGKRICCRDALKKYLAENGIPGMVYYPLPLQDQEAFRGIARVGSSGATSGPGNFVGKETAREEARALHISWELARSVLSLPMHTELTRGEQDYIVKKIGEFFRIKDSR